MVRCKRCQFRDLRRWNYCSRCGSPRHWRSYLWGGSMQFWIVIVIAYYCLRHLF